MIEYRFRLPAVGVEVEKRGGRFVCVITTVGGGDSWRGEHKTERGAVGAAMLAARESFAQCHGCGQWFYRDEMVQDMFDQWHCDVCAYDAMIPGEPERV